MIKLKKNFKKSFAIMNICALALLVIVNLLPVAGAQDSQERMITDVPRTQGQTGQTFDVLITDLTFSDPEPLEDEEITIFATVSNNGSFALDNLTVIFIIDTHELGRFPGIALNANESKTVNYTWTADKWDHNIGAMVGVDDVPLEDSIVYEKISVEAKPVGDITTLLLALIVIFIAVVIVSFSPSFWSAMKAAAKK